MPESCHAAPADSRRIFHGALRNAARYGKMSIILSGVCEFMENDRVFQMDFGRIYGLLLDKAVRKGRTRAEVDQVICWLTGYSEGELEELRSAAVSYGDFFRRAPLPHPNRTLIKGVVCGVRVEEVQAPLMREIRRLDKLIDELAKGRSMEKILRT